MPRVRWAAGKAGAVDYGRPVHGGQEMTLVFFGRQGYNIKKGV